MTSGGLLRTTVVACAVIAIAAAVAGSIFGRPMYGIGVALGVLLGSTNGYMIRGLMARGTPFALSGMVRIVLFSSLVLAAALTLRGSAWTIALGIGVAQLVLVAAGIRQALRA